MSKLLHLLIKWFQYVKNSIAFYPGLIAALMTGMAVLAIYMETAHITQKIANKLPVLIIHDPDTARSILNTMIGGIISLMVFSFSMVMVILNQASSNYTPRLLPGLITNKRHQVVLGIYLGTILFCILCSINVLPNEDSYSIPSLTILLSIILGVLCLGLFVYFIHSISESIQISKIIESLQLRGREDIEKLKLAPEHNSKHDRVFNQKIKSNKSGYLISVSFGALTELAQENDLHLEVLKPLGLFILEQEEIFALSRPVNEVIKNKMLNCIQCSDNEVLESSHLTSVKSITEIALKAMSPGINDPGTTLIALNYFFLLIAQRMNVGDEVCHLDKEEEPRVIERLLLFQQLMYSNLAELRTYAAHDPIVVSRLIEGFDYLLKQPAHRDDYYDIILQEKKVLLKQAKAEFKSDYDIEMISK